MKQIKYGIIEARNEAEDIRGWAKESLYFCEEVYCIVDPESSDNTAEILEVEFPEIHLEYQDRSLGDSDDGHKGPTGALIAHANRELWVNKLCEPGDWFMVMAPDERLLPWEFPILEEEIRLAKKYVYDGVWSYWYHTLSPLETHCVDHFQTSSRDSFRQIKFQKYRGHWGKNHEAHSGYSKGFPQNPLKSQCGFYHYCWAKKTRVPYAGWRDRKQYAELPLYYHPNPLPTWRDLEDFDVLLAKAKPLLQYSLAEVLLLSSFQDNRTLLETESWLLEGEARRRAAMEEARQAKIRWLKKKYGDQWEAHYRE